MRTEEEIKERIKLQKEGLKQFKKEAKDFGGANRIIASQCVVATDMVIENLEWVLNEETP